MPKCWIEVESFSQCEFQHPNNDFNDVDWCQIPGICRIAIESWTRFGGGQPSRKMISLLKSNTKDLCKVSLTITWTQSR